jgi:Ribonuclease toxin, BrnT, of type II toxin-antitoxin system
MAYRARLPLEKRHKNNYNFGVAMIRFEWDESKNRTNQRKHGVSFEIAARVFLDPLHCLDTGSHGER